MQRTIEIMAPGGGYVFVPSHNIQADVSPDHVHMAYDDTALRCRSYPTVASC